MEQKIEIKNAIIKSTMLGREDHGLMTFMLYLDYGGGGQGAGGYRLDSYDKEKKCSIGTAMGLEFIMKILEAVGVEKWEDLKGKHIRVKTSHNKVHEIGHFLKDNWLNFEQFGKSFFEN